MKNVHTGHTADSFEPGKYGDLLESISDYTGDSIIWMDLAGCILFISKRARWYFNKLLHKRLKEGKNLFDAFPASCRERLLKLFHKPCKGKPYTFLYKPDITGLSQKSFSVTIYRFYSGKEKEGVVLYARDITQQQLTGDKLIQSEMFYHSVLNHLDDLVQVLDTEGQIVYENRSLKKILGYEPWERSGRYAKEYIHPDDLAAWKAVFENPQRDAMTDQSLECRVRHKDQGWQWYQVSGNRNLRGGIPEGIVITYRRPAGLELLQSAADRKQDTSSFPVPKTGCWEISLNESPRVRLNLSQETFRVFGLDPSKDMLSPRRFMMGIPSEDRVRVKIAFKAALKGEGFYLSHRWQSPAGTRHFIYENGQPVSDPESRRVTKIIGYSQDITESANEYNYLKMSEQNVTAILNNTLNDYYILISPSYEILFRNKNCGNESIRLYGKRMEAGEYLTDYLSASFVPGFKRLVERCLTGESIRQEREIAFPNGDRFWFRIMLHAVHIKGNLIGIAINVIDLTLKRNYELALQNKNKALSDYAVMASHKLRAPLTNILGISNLLADFSAPQFKGYENLRDLLYDIRKQAETLDTVVQDLNNIISSDAGNVFYKSRLYRPVNRIILVDDDPVANLINREVISKVNGQVIVIAFTDPSEALEYLRVVPADLVLLDINMPDMNAWQFLEKMKEYRLTTDVVILSSSIDPRDRATAFSFSNVSSFLTKPLKHKDIKKILNNA